MCSTTSASHDLTICEGIEVAKKLEQSAARAQMRAAAETLSRLESPESMERISVPSLAEMGAVLHDLSVHQIELEMQNDELQRAGEALEASRARYFELYDLAPVGYLTIGESGTVKEANLTAANLLGLVRTQIVGQPINRFILVEDRDIYYVQRQQLLETSKPQVCELRFLKQGSGPFWARLEASLVRDTQDASTFHTVISDISERKRAELEQASLQAQLAHSQKMEAVGTLAGGIAHDFNNILTGILGGLSLLELELKGGEHQPDIDDMKGLAERAANLTQSLLGFARRGKNDVRPLDLALAVEKTMTMFGRSRRDVTLQRNVAPDLSAVLMDHTQLEQILLNLFINAGQAMPDGGTITVDLTNEELASEPPGTAACHFVRLAIKDTGIGMDAATQLRIFEPFFTTKDIGHGTGLGLASVYGIMKSHGGHVSVESQLGKGAVFTLLLPAVDMLPRPETAPPVAMTHGDETILIVDDEVAIRRVYSRLLTKLGYTVLLASGGRLALELIDKHRDQISLVILDMTMPEMSGSQTYKALQAVAPNCKVLLASGHSIDGQAQEILASGCNGFLQKPFNLATIGAKIREILQVSLCAPS